MIASNHRNDVMHVSCNHCSKEYAIFLNEKDFDEENKNNTRNSYSIIRWLSD